MSKTPPVVVATLVDPNGGDSMYLEFASLVASRTREGAVNLRIETARAPGAGAARTLVAQIQMDLPKAREVVGLLQGAIEAAVSDALLFRFLTTTVGMPEDAAGRALVQFREMRQGSRATVYPQ